MSLGRAMVALSEIAVGQRQIGRIREALRPDGLHGYDAFGLHPSGVAAGLVLNAPWYRKWFRVTSRGIERLPKQGAAILVMNHGGLLPFDGLMVWSDVVLKSDPPRIPRFVLDNFVLRIPIVSTVFTRSGAIGGSRANVHHLLERGELVALFPEGTDGVGKPASQRYRLQSWSVGHAEMALRHGAPVIPVAVLGPDEQFPLAVRLPVHAFGAPYVPIALPPIPMPVHYRILYGEPIDLRQRWRRSDVDLPAVIAEAAAFVREVLQGLLDQARREEA